MPSSNDYICLSLSDNTLKIIHVKGQGPSAKVSNIFSRDIKGMSDVEIPKIIESGLKGMPTKSANVIAIAPSNITTTKNIEIPSTNEQEIQSIVNLQASRHTPFSREEIQIGYIDIGLYKNNFTKVLLAMANRVQLKEQIRLYERAGLKIKKVIFAPESIAELYARSRLIKKSTDPIGVIDVDKKATNFVIVAKGKAIAARAIPVGRDDLTQDAVGAQSRLVDELKKTLESYQSEDIDQPPVSYIITNDDPPIKEFQNAIQTNLKWDVQHSPYVDLVKVPKSVLKQLAAQFNADSFLDVLAAAAMCNEAKINLMPEEVQLQKSIEDQRHQVTLTAILCVIILGLVACIFYLKLHFKKLYLNSMVKQYEDTRSQVNDLKNHDNKTKLIKSYLDTRMESLDVIHELYRHVPDNAYLTRITMDEDGTVNIQGVTHSASKVYELGSTLKDAELFNDSEVKSQKAKKDRGKDATAFEISLNTKEVVTPEPESEQPTKE